MRKSHQPLTTCAVLQKTTKLSRTLHLGFESKVNPTNAVAQTVPSQADPIIREPAVMNITYTCPSLLHKSFLWFSTALTGRGLLYEVPRSYNKFGRTLWTSDQPDLYLIHTHTHTRARETDIHTPDGIRNRNRSKQEIVNPHLRPHDHRNRLFHNRS